MRVTSKGQVTIPIDTREKLGTQPNTEVRLVVRKGIVVLEKVPGRGSIKHPNRGEGIVARLRRSARGATRSTMTTDELMKLTRAE